MKWILACLPLVLLFVHPATSSQCIQQEDPLRQVTKYLTGYFSTQWQVATTGKNQDMRTHVVRIWKSKKDAGVWLYYEKYYAAWPSIPIVQRALHVERREAIVEVKTYALYNARSAAGMWKSPESFPNLTPVLLDGCNLYITRVDANQFKGAVRKGRCQDGSKGAAYMARTVKLTAYAVIEERKGYKANGSVMWADSVEENTRHFEDDF